MFSLLLAIIISASFAQKSLASLGLQRTIGVGIGGIESHQISSSPGQGYGTRYYTNSYGTPLNNPAYSYANNYQRYGEFPQDVFVPGRVNPFSYPYRSSRSLNPSSPNRFYISSPNYVPFQPSQFYETVGTTSVPSSSRYNTERYPLMPYFESVATYLIYNTPKALETNSSRNISLESNTISGRNTSSDILSLQNELNNVPSSSRENDTTVKRERDLQMTYLGYMPSSAISENSQVPYKRSSDGLKQLAVPFYPLRAGSKALNSQRSKSSPPLLMSPYRLKDDQLRQSFSSYQQTGLGRPVIQQTTSTVQSYVSSFGRPSISHRPIPIPTANLPHTSVSYPPVPHYSLGRITKRLASPAPSTNSPMSYLPPIQHNQNGYYLFDVQPLHPVGGDAYFRSTSGLENPKKSGMIISDRENEYRQDLKSAKNAQRNNEAILPRGPTYPDLNIDTEYDEAEEDDPNLFEPGRQLLINPYGPTEMRLLVGRLLTLRRTPMFYPRYTL